MQNKPSALLISGSEERHVQKHEKLAKHLTDIGAGHRHLVLPSQKKLFEGLREFFIQSSSSYPVLISFYGHGSERGWENGSWSNTPYKKVVDLCCQFPHHIQFLNTTCYGQFLVKELIGRRSVKTTGAICDWESDAETYGNSIRDVLRAWPEGLRPEESMTEDIYSRDDGSFDLHFMPTLRWGAMFDNWFFSKKPQQAAV